MKKVPKKEDPKSQKVYRRPAEGKCNTEEKYEEIERPNSAETKRHQRTSKLRLQPSKRKKMKTVTNNTPNREL